MIGVALVFTVLWVLMLVQGGKVDRIVAEREREAAAGPPRPPEPVTAASGAVARLGA